MTAHALIIDDNTNNTHVLAELLTLEGVAYSIVHNPATLHEMLPLLGKVDVVFLDLEMPDLNGYQVLDVLRASPQFADAPVVAYTVHVNEINTARKMGFHSFLAKPLDGDEFPQQLARILRGESVWAAR